MTNGEMIQKVFNCEVCEPIFEDDIIHVIFADKKGSAIGFDWSWWSMEYKESTTKNDLSIDEAIKDYKEMKKGWCLINPDPLFDFTIDILQKYQKIEDIYYHQLGKALEDSLREVIENDKDN